MARKRAIGELLLEAHLVDEAQLALAMDHQRLTGSKLGSALVELRLVDENVLAAFLSKQIDVPCVSLLNVEIPAQIHRRVPPALAHRLGVMPIGVRGNTLQVAMIDPTDIDQVTLLEEASGLRVEPLVAPESSIRRVLQKIYPLGEDGLPMADPDHQGDPILFPELAREMDEMGGPMLAGRLEGIETEIRALRARIEELVALVRAG